ncbi:MAG: M28 family peptidase [Acidobacteriota bacterium]
MPLLAVAALAVATATPVETRAFWKTDVGAMAQPVQSRITADRVAEGTHLDVFQERGYSFSTTGPEDERAQLAAIVSAFDTVIYPREVALSGSCPDLDGNGKVIVLITSLPKARALFFRFDEMDEAAALRSGFHSNQGEVLYHAFDQQGNRAVRNIAALARTFHQLLEYAHGPARTSWSELMANFQPFRLGLASPRSLWGDDDPLAGQPLPGDPWDTHGWPILYIDYLAERIGDEGLADLIKRPESGFAAISAVLASRGQDPASAADALADFAMAAWLDDHNLARGRFAFSSVTPPRPEPAARLVASRPTSGQTLVGVGGMVVLLVAADDEKPLPLTLRGDPQTRWVARAVHLKPAGPDHETPVVFDATGAARIDLSSEKPGDAVVVTAVPLPADDDGLDHRRVALQWGLGWVPAAAHDRAREGFDEALQKAFPDGGQAARARLLATVERLGGLQAGDDGQTVTTRYAWAPERTEVIAELRREAQARGLHAEVQPFLRVAPGEIKQEWQNLVIELPGSDPRRWPIVLAAHWDGARTRLDDSYLRADNLDDNACGVAVALEAAAAMARVPHRVPILVALLSGGYHGAAGAQALLDQLQSRVTGWVELDAVGVAENWPHQATVRLERAGKVESFSLVLSQNLKHNGLTPRSYPRPSSGHTALSLPGSAGFPAVLVRTRDVGPDPMQLDLPPSVERQELSPELMVLLAKGLATGLLQIAGSP